MKLKSFGCSFVYGSDLSDCTHKRASHLTWPALLADKLDLPYECHARPGIGNLQIMQKILQQVADPELSVFVINWTWLDRFDYMHPVDESFLTLRPDGNSIEHKLYYKYFYNQYHTMLTNGAWILAVLMLLHAKNIPYIMTCQDSILMEAVNPNWQDSISMSQLQDHIGPYLQWFENKSFLDWSKSKQFTISPLLHPLETAHAAAADYMIKIFDKQKIVYPVL